QEAYRHGSDGCGRGLGAGSWRRARVLAHVLHESYRRPVLRAARLRPEDRRVRKTALAVDIHGHCAESEARATLGGLAPRCERWAGTANDSSVFRPFTWHLRESKGGSEQRLCEGD